MRLGDVACIEEGLLSSCTYDRFNAIMSATKYNVIENNIISLIRSLIDDNEVAFSGNPDSTVGNFAVAALDIMGIEKYVGNNQYVKQLIQYTLGVVR